MGRLKNAKHERFCHEYIKDQNGAQAYIRTGYSEKGAKESASRLLTNANIVNRIEELRAPILEKCEIDTEWIINKHKELIEYGLEKDEFGQARETTCVNKSLDALAKIKGSYAPEKQEVEHNINEIKFTLVKPK